MNDYLNIQAIGIVLLALTFNKYCVILSAIECCFCICSLRFYRQCKKLSQEDAGKTTESTVIKFDNGPSTPPQYNSCENDAQVRSDTNEDTRPQNDTNEDTRPQNDTTENTVIQFDKLSYPTTLKNSCENRTPPQKNPTENTVIESDKLPSLSTLNNSCENDTQPENAGIYPKPNP